jgi:hypothetical protein
MVRVIGHVRGSYLRIVTYDVSNLKDKEIEKYASFFSTKR